MPVMEWKAEYGLLMFLAFAGVTYSLTQGSQTTGTIGKRLYAQLYAFIVTCVICIGLMLMLGGWHIVIVAIWTCFIAPVMERAIWLWFQSQNSSRSIWQFIKRFKRTWDAIEKENPLDDEPKTDNLS